MPKTNLNILHCSRKDEARFWAKVQKGSEDECWLWQGALTKDGYGRFKIGNRVFYAHRIAYAIQWGDSPDSSITHKSECNNNRCVNPNHLFDKSHTNVILESVRHHRARPAIARDKPRPDFPLFPHASGRWAKKVKGNLLYFGSTASDPKGDAALGAWLQEKDYCLLHGRRPAKARAGLTVKDLVDRVLDYKLLQVKNDQLSPLTFRQWRRGCTMLLKQFVATRSVESLGPDDFDALFRTQISGKSTSTRCQYITLVRGIFGFAHNSEQRLIATPVLMGQSMRVPKKPSGASTRKCFTALQIHQLLSVVNQRTQAMILLGINCAFGNNDCATLRFEDLDLETGWHVHARPKNKMPRRCPLWPETVAAIRAAIQSRPKPRNPEDSRLVFLTQNGTPYCHYSDSVAANNGTEIEWRNPLGFRIWVAKRKLGITDPLLTFYSLRHTFESVAAESEMPIAVDRITGHRTPGMGTNYRHMEVYPDAKLLTVSNLVHDWLYAPAVIAHAPRPRGGHKTVASDRLDAKPVSG